MYLSNGVQREPVSSSTQAQETATYRKHDSLKMAYIHNETRGPTRCEEGQQMRRKEGYARHLSDIPSQHKTALTPCRAMSRTCRSSNNRRATISLIRVGRSGFSTTMTLRDLGSVMRCLWTGGRVRTSAREHDQGS